ncbi:LysM peptidoglycan-binding domain-containing protein [Treponema phagedenis]|uniref:Hsp70 family protein n=1 Tax=Treponema phagedenis TaxID=162 RepID=A0A0B7GT10_TREPH|nr:Hsp70 family protein [Treponema phagedenis]EFW36578.1 LysM domain protein [Treponema phagedenis F0421]NVP23349.1 Hsp70 family protein [Treponema phagedenis]QEJ95565.1 Hsp70 family protein [Treponema phagedenis]QEJ98458.1 Hsp70 family protein [Treponema phagedenis]QEK01418.1 Hsp70 family protein [Treponema phagedenis]
MASKIGIKLADGRFFPIMDENSLSSEELELTTVRDNQTSVQINLFKKQDVAEPEYIGSLIVEDIKAKPAGDPTIELKLSLDEDKNLSAEAIDVDSGTRQGLKVSLETLDSNAFDIPDFDLSPVNDNIDFGSDPSFDNLAFSAAQESEQKKEKEYKQDHKYEEKEKRGLPLWLLIILVLLGIAILVLAILLLTRSIGRSSKEQDSPAPVEKTIDKKDTEQIESERTQGKTTEPPKPAESEIKATESVQVEKEPDVVQIETKQDEVQKPVQETVQKPAEEPVQKLAQVQETVEKPIADKKETRPEPVTPGAAVRHKIKWGDTLWDLSDTYYKNPWLYKKIARHNKIKNPDLIISGRYIEIPPK